MQDEEKDMLFLLEHFSLSDMIKAENDANEMFDQDTDNIEDMYHEEKFYNTFDDFEEEY